MRILSTLGVIMYYRELSLLFVKQRKCTLTTRVPFFLFVEVGVIDYTVLTSLKLHHSRLHYRSTDCSSLLACRLAVNAIKGTSVSE